MDFPPHDDAPPMASPLAGVVAAFMPRLAEFAFDPGLLAAIDQHAAAVCDTLSLDPPYAPVPTGWEEPVGYDFATLRLTAICWLVREQDLLAF
jgi:hypothetical protein